MNQLAPEVSVLCLSIGLVFALFCYLVTNLSPGGMITPGWLALVLISDPGFALLILGVALVTYVVSRGLQKVVILYGKRLFATVVLVGVFLQVTIFLFETAVIRSADYTTLGFIIPGLLAYQLIRQPIVATLISTTTVASLAYVVVLIGVVLGFVRTETGAPAVGGVENGDFALNPVLLGFVAAALSIGAIAFLRANRRVERPAPAAVGMIDA